MSFRWLINEFKKDWNKKPNLITLFRLGLSLFPAILLSTGSEIDRIMALILFLILINTDWVDGYVARRFNQQTELGRIMDPVADRVITGSIMIVLMFQNINKLWLEFVLGWLLLAAIIISVLLFRAKVNNLDAKPNLAGKRKTVFLSALVICLVGESISWLDILSIFVAPLAVITIILSLISFAQYFKDYAKMQI